MAVAVALLVLVLSLAALGLVGWRVFGRVRALGRTVAAAGERIAAASMELEALAPRDDGLD